MIEVSWQVDGKTEHHRAEELLYNQENKTAMEQDHWVYNGSAIWDGHFLAQREGSIVSPVTDPVCLANNNGSGHDNDKIWIPNASQLPPTNALVSVTFRLPANPSKNQD
jgi:hypothetical protein